jgi:hypothetical protein
LSSFAFNQVQIDNYRREQLARTDDLKPLEPSKANDQVRKPRTHALPPPSPDEVKLALKVSTLTIEWLAGDGSDRCYYRIQSPELKSSLVLMQLSGNDAKALAENGYDWIKIADILSGNGIFVPRVIASMPEHAALVIEDYGDLMLENTVFHLAEKHQAVDIENIYKECFGILARFLKIPRDDSATWCQRAFDHERFTWELNFFVDKYLVAALDIRFTEAEKRRFAAEAETLSSFLAGHSGYFVHRDFHSRNVMVQNKTLAVIDFQDARLGPPSYDLVSLCFDSYVPFSPSMRSALFRSALDVFAPVLSEKTMSEVIDTWKPMLLQRQLKAIGSFGFLTIDKKRGDYLKYVGPAIDAVINADVGDDRWPMLSRDIPAMIQSALTTKRHD